MLQHEKYWMKARLRLPCQAGKTWNCKAKPWSYNYRQTYNHCVGSPFLIKYVEHFVMYGVIVKMNGSAPKISLIIKTARNPLYFKRNTMTGANI